MMSGVTPQIEFRRGIEENVRFWSRKRRIARFGKEKVS